MDSGSAHSDCATEIIDLVTRFREVNLPSELNHYDLLEGANAQLPLLRLPGEVRNLIFEFAIYSDIRERYGCRNLRVDPSDPYSATEDMERQRELKPLLFGSSFINTCRQIRAECRSLMQLDKVSILQYDTKLKATVLGDVKRLEQQILDTDENYFFVFGLETIDSGKAWLEHWGADTKWNCGIVSFGEKQRLAPRIFVSTKMHGDIDY